MNKVFLRLLLLCLWLSSTGKGVFALDNDPLIADSVGVYLKTGKGLLGQGKYSEAYQLLSEATQVCCLPSPEDTLMVYLQLEAGLAAYLMGEPKLASEHYQVVLDRIDLTDRTSPRTLIDANYRMGIAFRELGDLYLAIDFLEDALHLAELGEEGNMDIGKCNNALGNLQIRLRNFPAALRNYQDAKEIIALKFGAGHSHVASILGNMGMAYQELDSFPAALSAHFAALAIRKKVLRNNHPTIALNHNNLGDAYLAMGDLEVAEFHYRKSLEMWQSELGPDHINIAIANYNLGDVHRGRKEWVQALEAYQQAIFKLDPEHATVQWDAENLGTEPRSYTIYLEALRRKASLLREMGMAEGDMSLLRDHFSIYEDIHHLILEMRKGFKRESSSRELVAISLGAYEEAVQTCIDLSASASGEQGWGRSALNFAEAAKGVSLDAAIGTRNALRFDGPLAGLVEREKVIQENINGTQLAIDQLRKSREGKPDSLFEILSEFKSDYNTLVDSIKHQFPDYYELKHQSKEEWSLSWLEEIDLETALLSYFVGEDSLFGFGIVRGQIFVQNLLSKEDLWKLVEEFRNALVNRKPFWEKNELLSEAILWPLLDQFGKNDFQRMVIFRDGCLEYIPFEVLLVGNREEDGMLIEQVPISYGYSLRSYFRDRGEMKTPQNYLGFARAFERGYKTEEETLSALPNAVEEVKNAGDLFTGMSFFNEDATESALRRESGQGGILHLATHALLDDGNPLFSRLILGEEKGDEQTADGSLYTYELFDLNIGAELAILSACNTGNGQLQSGEGMMSLARGFVYAGCPSILMNHWAASDRESALIISDFLGFLSEGVDKDRALQQAKLGYLKNADEVRSHPYFWAGLGLIGDARPMNLEQASEIPWFWLIGVVALVLIGITIMKFKRNRLLKR